MKKLINLKGANALNKKEQQNINGGRLSICIPQFEIQCGGICVPIGECPC